MLTMIARVTTPPAKIVWYALKRRVLGPDDQAAVFDDVRLAGQAGGQHAQERVDDRDEDDAEDADLDDLFERRLVFEPGWPLASCDGASDCDSHQLYTPSWPILCANLFAADDQQRCR